MNALARKSPSFMGIYRKGKAVALAGQPRECPYEVSTTSIKVRQAWLAGWDAGEKQRGKAA